MRRLGFIILAILVLTGTGAFAYTGSLSIPATDGLLDGTGIWVDKTLLPPDEQADWTAPLMAWAVTQNPDSTWHYDYQLSVYKGDVSHVIIETSLNFTEIDVMNPSWQNIEIGWHSSGSPGLPGPIYGIKFDATTGTTFDFSFDSTRMPVWGDFYAKDGKKGGNWNAVWNAGFTNPDNDYPLVAASNGSHMNHILVPDTIIPEPGSLMSLALGFSGLVGLIIRKRR